MAMLTKFETRSNRVKGLSFHPHRPWVLASLHNSVIQLWDYRMGTLIDCFEEHEGPVRGVDFHSNQPLFCSGGDDYLVKVWNYKSRRCLFTLFGHIDYVRTVQFHKEQPWILSASDDQTLRIWNWQSRGCIQVLAGHNHYVMCAQFHPREDYVVSASLDCNLRVWSIGGLRTKKSHGVGLSQDLFGSNDVHARHIIDGHEKGVNWASFHPTHPFIVSAADDRTIKIWKMDEFRAYILETLTGHIGNVSCVMYYKDYIVSNSEDRSIRVWDVKQKTAIHVLRREHNLDRFWILAVHPENNLLAAGHDQGMFVFKLERERPAHAIHNNMLYYVKDRTVKSYDFQSGVDATMFALKRNTFPPVTMSYSATENQMAFWYNYDGGTTELYPVPKPGIQSENPQRGVNYTGAVFFSRTKFASLSSKTRQIVIRNSAKFSGNDVAKTIDAVGETTMVHPAPPGYLILVAPTTVYLYDMNQKKEVAQCTAHHIKYVVWSNDNNHVALIAKHQMLVCSRRLRVITSVHENARIKSVAFDEERGVVIYATSNHLRFCLPSGDTGTIKTMPDPIYLVRFRGDEMWYLGRDSKVHHEKVELTEMRLKLALSQERYQEVFKIIKSHKLHGTAMVAYMQKKNFPEIAMHFVNDPQTRFNLAIECGNLDVARETATQISLPECWQQLSDKALQMGNIQLAQYALTKAKNHHGLAFTHVLTGDHEGLHELIHGGSLNSNEMFQFALFTGDIEARIKVLEDSKQYPLAMALCKSHNLVDKYKQLQHALFTSLVKSKAKSDPSTGEYIPTSLEQAEEYASQVLQTIGEAPINPPIDSVCVTSHAKRKEDSDAGIAWVPTGAVVNTVDSNWPMLDIPDSYIQRMLRERSLFGDNAPEDDAIGAAPLWGEQLDLDDDEEGAKVLQGQEGAEDGEDDGEWKFNLEGLEEEDKSLLATEKSATQSARFIVPREGHSIASRWASRSDVAADHIAAGSFDTAMHVLQRQCGIIDFRPLKPYFMQIATSAFAYVPSFGLHAAHATPVLRGNPVNDEHLPLLPFTLETINELKKVGSNHFTKGKFVAALHAFQQILHTALFVVVNTKEELADLRASIAMAKEYATALAVELERQANKEDKQRSTELAAYFTHFDLRPPHLQLTLFSAMSTAFNAKNLKTAAIMANHFLQHEVSAQQAENARKVIALAQKSPTNASEVNYDERNPFVLCAASKVPIYRGTLEPIRCSYCFATYKPDFRGTKCVICSIGSVGGKATGLVSRRYNAGDNEK